MEGLPLLGHGDWQDGIDNVLLGAYKPNPEQAQYQGGPCLSACI